MGDIVDASCRQSQDIQCDFSGQSFFFSDASTGTVKLFVCFTGRVLMELKFSNISLQYFISNINSYVSEVQQYCVMLKRKWCKVNWILVCQPSQSHACAFQAIRKINKLTPWINGWVCRTPSNINFEAEWYLHCYLYCKISKGY